MIPKSRITMRFSGFWLLFIFLLLRFVLKKQYQNCTVTAAFFFGEYISKFAILFLFCRAAADLIPTLFPTLFRHSVYGILRFCGGFYILIIAQKHCGYQEIILRRTSGRRQFRRRGLTCRFGRCFSPAARGLHRRPAPPLTIPLKLYAI